MIDFDDLDSAEEAQGAPAAEPGAAGPGAGLDAPRSPRGPRSAEGAPPPPSPAARCAHERARPPVPAPGPRGRSRRRRQLGVLYGLPFPWSPGAVKALGAEWLTEALRAARTLPSGCEVAAINGFRCLGVRNRVRQVLVEVEYSNDAEQVFHRELLIKLPSFNPSGADTVADEAPAASAPSSDHFLEINFYRLFEADAPFCMPRFYFGDVSDQTENFILITEWVPVSNGALDLTDSQLCFIRGFHGMYLASNPSDSGLFMSPKRKEWETWAVRPSVPGGRHYLQACGGGYLMVTSDEEQAMGISPDRDELTRWTICPAPGTGGYHFLMSRHRTYLSSLRDSEQTLYMSPNTKDWEKWRLVPLETVEARRPGPRHLDLRGADYGALEALVGASAELAALGPAGRLRGLGAGAGAEAEAGAPGGALLQGPAAWADRGFLDRAGEAQDFICRAGDALFPPGVVTSLSMQRYRAMLVTAKSNLEEMRYFVSCMGDYNVLGLDCLDIDSAFLRRGEKCREGIRHWDGLSFGSAGCKLWKLLRFARPDILLHHAGELMETFISKYQQHGGPLLSMEVLWAHFMIAAVLEGLELLGLVPEFYRCCPREEWASVTSLGDPRLAAQRTTRGSLWLCLKSFASLFVLLERHDIKALLLALLPWCFVTYALGSGRMQGLQVAAAGGAEVRAEPGAGPLVARLPRGCWVIAPQYPVPVACGGRTLVQLRFPVPYGWLALEDLEAAPAAAALVACLQSGQPFAPVGPSAEDEAGRLHMELAALSFSIRRQYAGASPGGMAEIATSMLHARYVQHPLLSATPARVVRGSFLARQSRRSWWPLGYEDWAHHAFMVLDGGRILDITADQFDDDAPQVWWPADGGRYTHDFQKADAANRLRRDRIGIQDWTRLCEEDDAADGTTRYPWWTVDWHTTMRLPPRGGAVLRHNEAVELPPVARRVDLGEGRAAAAFRRLTAEHELEVWLVEDLFRREEVEQLVRCCEARRGFQQSLTKTAGGEVVSDGRRTSSTCPVFWPHLCAGALEEMREAWGGARADEELAAAARAAQLCAGALEVDVARIEPLQLVKYAPGQHYLPHLDAHQEPERLSSFGGEQRLQTLLVFMSDVPEKDGGGHLHFPLLGLRILPRAGSAVLWSNVRPGSSQPNPDSLHEGMAPLASGKVAMNVWVVDRPLTAASVFSGRRRSCARARAAPLGGAR